MSSGKIDHKGIVSYTKKYSSQFSLSNEVFTEQVTDYSAIRNNPKVFLILKFKLEMK